MYVYIYIYMYVYLYICIYIRTYINIYIYIYIYIYKIYFVFYPAVHEPAATAITRSTPPAEGHVRRRVLDNLSRTNTQFSIQSGPQTFYSRFEIELWRSQRKVAFLIE